MRAPLTPNATKPFSRLQWNHLGHFAFVHYLTPLLVKTARDNPPSSSVRIVNLASLGHKLMNKPDFSSIEGANKSYGSTWKRYGQAKLANILFTTELQERFKGENIKVRLFRASPSHSSIDSHVLDDTSDRSTRRTQVSSTPSWREDPPLPTERSL